MSTITGSVLKDTKDSLVGIAFSQEPSDAPLAIKYIYQGGLFDSTDLVPGLKVVRINDIDVSGKSAKEAAELIKQLEGIVSVTADGVRATVEKPAKSSKVGISLTNKSKFVIISRINPQGLFASSGLRVGQRVVSIAGYVCPPSAAAAIKIVQNAHILTIIAAPVAVGDSIATTVSPHDNDASSSHYCIRAKILSKLLPTVSSRSLTSGQWPGTMETTAMAVGDSIATAVSPNDDNASSSHYCIRAKVLPIFLPTVSRRSLTSGQWSGTMETTAISHTWAE